MSVLVLAYNHGPYLGDALDSILKQKTRFPFEILVGEDRSTDDTLTVARRYEAENPKIIRVVTSADNVGMQENFFRLIRAGEGRFLAFCDGDDYWNSCAKLESQADYLDARPEYGAVHSDFEHIVFDRGRWRALARFWQANRVAIPQGNVFDELLQRNFIQTCTLMVRADLAKSYVASEFATRGYKVGDWPLCLYISAQSMVGYMPEPLATYRKVEGSATNRGHKADISRGLDHMSMATDFVRWAGSSPELERAAHERAMRGVLDQGVRALDVDATRTALTWLDENTGETSLRSKIRRATLSSGVGIRAFRRYAGLTPSTGLSGYDEEAQAPGDCG